MWDGNSTTNLQAISDGIAANVLGQVIDDGGVPALEAIASHDISLALSQGSISLGGWGGSFYYWDLAYTDESGTFTVGQRIMGDAADLEKFIAVNAQAAIETLGVEISEFARIFGGDTSGIDGDANAIISAFISWRRGGRTDCQRVFAG